MANPPPGLAPVLAPSVARWQFNVSVSSSSAASTAGRWWRRSVKRVDHRTELPHVATTVASNPRRSCHAQLADLNGKSCQGWLDNDKYMLEKWQILKPVHQCMVKFINLTK